MAGSRPQQICEPFEGTYVLNQQDRMPQIAFLLGVLLTLVSTSGLHAQRTNLRLGMGAEFVALIGHWRSVPQSGPGVSAFLGLDHGLLEARLGGAVSFHPEEPVTVVSSPGSSADRTHHLQRVFGQVRLGLRDRASGLTPSLGLGLGALRAASLINPPWAWHFEVLASAALSVPARPEVFVAGGLVRFPAEPFPRPQTANTVRLGVEVSTGLGR